MTGNRAIEHVRQNIADKLGGDAVIPQNTLLQEVLNHYVLPNLVTMHDWSWKYDYLDQVLPSGTWKFVPDFTTLLNTVFDDLYAIVLMTGSLGTTWRIPQRNWKWFLDRFPDPSIQPKGRPDWCTLVGSSGGSKIEIWLDRPLDAQYTVRLIFLKTFFIGSFSGELPLRFDKHMLLVAGTTAWAFASLEQMSPPAPGVGSPADWWQRIYMDGINTWWMQDQSQSGIETNLGMYRPRFTQGRLRSGEYWSNPFVGSVIAGDTGE